MSTKAKTLEDAGMYLFMDGFDESSCAKAIRFILEKNLITGEDRPKFLTMIICSPGGNSCACMALIDTMKTSSIPVRTVGIGQICSCGIVLFMAGEKGFRFLTPNTSILSHQWAWGSRGKEHELFAAVREFELTGERILRHYRKCTGLSDDLIKKILLPPQDVWLTPEEAVRYGIADRIVETY